ncbi:MAG: diguanylate cyclase domain-containing protein [Lachnospiraceae bacterium]
MLLIILFNSKKPLHHGLLNEKTYYMMVALNILQCLIESAVFFMDGKTAYGYHTLLIVLNAILFINNIIFAFLWTIYADFKLFADMKRIKRVYPFMAIPAMLIIIGCLVNLITPVFFAIDAYNIYKRTALFIIPYIVTYSYMAYGVILIYLYRKKVYKYLFLPAILFMIPIIIGSLLQFFFYGYSLIWLGVSIGMVLLFINLQNESSYVDVQSGLFNRHYLNNLLSTHGKRGESAGVLAGIMLDIDNLKNINDNLGHLVGDDVISTAGRILRTSVCDKGVVCDKKTLFRYGGDEFIILMYINSRKEITDTIDMIKQQAALFNESEKKPYEISFSIGYGTHEKEHESIDDFLKKIDTAMYEDKKRKIDEKIIPDRRRRN